MKWKVLLVLAAFLFSLLAPLALFPGISDGHITIGTIDVCHSGHAAVAANAHMACIDTAERHIIPLLSISYEEVFGDRICLTLLPQLTEHPPRA